jgi:hypothetical protein
VRDQDDALAIGTQREVRVVPPDQATNHAHLDVEQIIEPVHQHGVTGTRPLRLVFENAQLEAARCAEMVVADVGDRSVDQLFIVEHQDLRLEDLRFDRAEPLRRLRLDLANAGLGPFAGFVETFDLVFDVGGRDGHMRRTRRLPAQYMRRPDHDAW